MALPTWLLMSTPPVTLHFVNGNSRTSIKEHMLHLTRWLQHCRSYEAYTGNILAQRCIYTCIYIYSSGRNWLIIGCTEEFYFSSLHDMVQRYVTCTPLRMYVVYWELLWQLPPVAVIATLTAITYRKMAAPIQRRPSALIRIDTFYWLCPVS